LASVPLWGGFTAADDVYYWFACRQSSAGPVFPESDDRLSIEEQALSIFVFLERGHYHRAKRVLAYLDELRERAGKGFAGFYPLYGPGSYPLENDIRARDQLWVIQAVARYTERTADRSFLPLAETLAKTVLLLEGPEGGIMKKVPEGDTPEEMTARDNLLACSSFWSLWNVTRAAGYRSAALRTYQYLDRFLKDARTGEYARSNTDTQVFPDDALTAALILGKPSKLPDRKETAVGAKQALVALQRGERDAWSLRVRGLEKNRVRSRTHIGAAALLSEGPPEGIPDLTASAWYLFAAGGSSPFAGLPSPEHDAADHFRASGNFSGDNFENGRLATLLAYTLAQEGEGNINRPRLDWAREAENGVLRILLPAKSAAAPLKFTVSRKYLKFQDFSLATGIKFTLKAFPGTGGADPVVRMAVGFVDADGELWAAEDIELRRRTNFTYTLPFPSGWKCVRGRGNGIFDTNRVGEMAILISQYNDNPWEISLDNIVLK
ncbi:MAG: hypothetical protein ACYC5N_11855, partial [Endomicrobiales bacterium]